MSTITVSNIKATGETASRAVSGVAAAWVNFNGTGTIAVRNSLNISSLTDLGTGQYNVNHSNSFSGDYSVTAWPSDAGYGGVAFFNNNADLISTRNYIAVFPNSGSTNPADVNTINETINGDLA